MSDANARAVGPMKAACRAERTVTVTGVPRNVCFLDVHGQRGFRTYGVHSRAETV